MFEDLKSFNSCFNHAVRPHLVKHAPLKDAPEMLMILVDRPILKRLVVDPVYDRHCHRGVVPAQEGKG